jgi:hypothetical protein
MTVTEAKVGASGGLIGVVAVGEGVDVRVWFVRGGGNGGNLMTSPTIAASAMGVLRAVGGARGGKAGGEALRERRRAGLHHRPIRRSIAR